MLSGQDCVKLFLAVDGRENQTGIVVKQALVVSSKFHAAGFMFDIQRDVLRI